MSAVWAAYDHTLKRSVALRMMLPLPGEQLTNEPRQRILREARAYEKLSHRHIVQLFDVGETPEGARFIVFELLRGKTLADRLKEKRRIEPVVAARIAAEVASGLAAAHAANVIHHYLKPKNIFLHHEEGTPADLFVSKILDFGVCKSLGSVESEATRGKTLADRLKEKRRIEPMVAARIAAKVASGLAVAHPANVIHHYLKPKNIFLHHEEGTPADLLVSKILDSGVCKSLESVESAATRTGIVVGSPAYMSPEQVCSRKDLDHRTDQWSLGVVLFEMLTGTRPFTGSIENVIRDTLLTQVPPPSSKVRDVPPELDEIVARCTARSRNERYASTDELSSALFTIARTMRPRICSSTLTYVGAPPSAQPILIQDHARTALPMSVSAPALIAPAYDAIGLTPEGDDNSALPGIAPLRGRMPEQVAHEGTLMVMDSQVQPASGVDHAGTTSNAGALALPTRGYMEAPTPPGPSTPMMIKPAIAAGKYKQAKKALFGLLSVGIVAALGAMGLLAVSVESLATWDAVQAKDPQLAAPIMTNPSLADIASPTAAPMASEAVPQAVSATPWEPAVSRQAPPRGQFSALSTKSNPQSSARASLFDLAPFEHAPKLESSAPLPKPTPRPTVTRCTGAGLAKKCSDKNGGHVPSFIIP